MKLGLLLRNELTKIFGQKGTYVGYGVLLVLSGLVVWASWRYGPPWGEHLAHNSEFIVGGNLVTGATIACYIMIPSMLVLIPLLVSVISGGVFAGEMQRGTMRTLLCKPVGRVAVATSKYIAGWIHATSLTLFLGIVTLLLGSIVLGRGDLISMEGGLTILPEPLALRRLLEAYLIAAFAMCAVASLAMTLSQLVQSPLTAAAIALAFLLVGATISGIPYFEFMKPYLLSTHLMTYSEVFHSTVDRAVLRWPLVCVGLYTIVPFIIGLITFRCRDIKC